MLNFDTNMSDFLRFSAKSSIISQILINSTMDSDSASSLIVEEGNYIKRVETEIDMVSYLPVSKYEKVEDVWNKSRTPIKIGKFVRKFFNEYAISRYEIDDSKIEKFVNLFKSYFEMDLSKLKVVEGDDIMKYYLEDNYHINGGAYGTLWNSCMRQSERNKFLKIYSKNDSVKMLVFFDRIGRVRARAILWECVKDHNDSTTEYKFMDRIYTYYDHDVDFFKEWAKKNGYITKYQQSAKSEKLFEVNGVLKSMDLYVCLNKHRMDYYPYLDTFKYYDVEIGRFSNSRYYNYDFCLIQSNGDVEPTPSEEESEEDGF